MKKLKIILKENNLINSSSEQNKDNVEKKTKFELKFPFTRQIVV